MDAKLRKYIERTVCTLMHRTYTEHLERAHEYYLSKIDHSTSNGEPCNCPQCTGDEEMLMMWRKHFEVAFSTGLLAFGEVLEDNLVEFYKSGDSSRVNISNSFNCPN